MPPPHQAINQHARSGSMSLAVAELYPSQRLPGGLRRDLGLSVYEGAAYSLMVGLGETFLPAFILAIGLDQVIAGLIASVPMLTGAILQLVSPFGVRLLGSHRRWVVGCVTLQAFVFVALASVALIGKLPATAAFLIAAVYWGSGMAAGPAWNTWIGTLIPTRVRTKFFARRSRFLQLFTLVGFVVGGYTLQNARASGVELTAFALLFAAAGLFRLVSAALLARHSEPVPMPANLRMVPVSTLFNRVKDSPDGKFLLYLLIVQVTVQVSAPYFTPFMLSQLKLSYLDYTTLVAVAFSARVLSLPLLGRFAHRASAGRLLLACGILMAPLSATWIFAYPNFLALIGVQILSGVIWGGYELATTLLIFERIDPAERTSILTTYNFVNASALLFGSLIGGSVLSYMNESFNGYLSIFALSSVLRIMTIVLLLRTWRARA